MIFVVRGPYLLTRAFLKTKLSSAKTPWEERWTHDDHQCFSSAANRLQHWEAVENQPRPVDLEDRSTLDGRRPTVDLEDQGQLG